MDLFLTLVLAFIAVFVGAMLDRLIDFHRAGLARLRTYNARQATGQLVHLRHANYGRPGDPAA